MPKVKVFMTRVTIGFALAEINQRIDKWLTSLEMHDHRLEVFVDTQSHTDHITSAGQHYTTIVCTVTVDFRRL